MQNMNKAIQETAMIPVVGTGNQTIDPAVLWLSQIILRILGVHWHHYPSCNSYLLCTSYSPRAENILSPRTGQPWLVELTDVEYKVNR